MSAWSIEGQDQAVQFLQRALKEDKLHHAHLFIGPPHCGKMTLAVKLAQALNCTEQHTPCEQCNPCLRIASGHHTDVQVINLDSTVEGRLRVEIGIDQIRELQRAASLRPYEGRTRVFIVDGAEQLSQEAANSLLKTLEEPPSDVLIVLLAVHEEDLPTTISSRCNRLDIRALPVSKVAEFLQQHHQVSLDSAQEIARLSQGCLGWAISAVENEEILGQWWTEVNRQITLIEAPISDRFNYADKLAKLFQQDRAAAQQRLFVMLRWWRDVLLASQGLDQQIIHLSRHETLKSLAATYTTKDIAQFLGTIFATLRSLDKNANPRLALEVLALRMPRARSLS